MIIPVFNDRAGLAKCLQSLSRQSIGVDQFEAIVVDNGSDDVPDEIVALFPFARCLVEPLPGSYNARNAGAALARGELLAFTDSDCRPRPDWLANAARYLSSNIGVSAIGGAVNVHAGRSPSASELYEMVYAFRQDRYVGQYGFAATANLVVRRAVFECVGPFDGSRRSGGDREWGQRLTGSGHVLRYVADVAVDHPARSALRPLVRKRRRLVGGRLMAPVPTSCEPGLAAWVDPQPRGIRMLFGLVASPRLVGLDGVQGWRVLGIMGVLWVVECFERMRLRLGGDPLR